MGNPKMKVTKSKQGNRRSHHHAESLASGKCSNCGELKQAHTVCPSCGFYDKRQVVKKEEL
jgi:large subunit ribosomal protein L32